MLKSEELMFVEVLIVEFSKEVLNSISTLPS